MTKRPKTKTWLAPENMDQLDSRPPSEMKPALKPELDRALAEFDRRYGGRGR